MQLKQRIIWLVSCAFMITGTSFGFFPINIFRSFDINVRFTPPPCTRFTFGSWLEAGYKAHGVNRFGDEGDVLTIWNDTQDSIAMLKGFPDDSPITQFLESLDNMVPGNEIIDNGIRGHFKLTSDFDYKAGFSFYGRYHFPYTNFYLGLYVPFYSMRLKNVRFEDLTSESNSSPQDTVVREQLTSQLFSVINQFDSSMTFSGWNRTGIGDSSLIAEWYDHYPQGKPILKDVGLTARLGLILPTGLRKNEDEIFSIPFGSDGSAGLFVGAGLNVNWFNLFRFGLDFQFFHFFGNNKTRRIKTDVSQTELLLLAKEKTYLDPGFVQRYNLFFETYHFFKGLSASVTYQFWRHNRDRLALCSNQYPTDIADTAQSLKEWTMHNFIFKLWYERCDTSDVAVVPQFGAFYKLPFNGKRAVLVNTAGILFALNF